MPVTVSFDERSCTADAVQRAGYRLCARLSVEFRIADGEIVCQLWSVSGDEPAAADVADFRIEVTDQVLRERIRAETAAVRNLVLALAFSRTDLSDES